MGTSLPSRRRSIWTWTRCNGDEGGDRVQLEPPHRAGGLAAGWIQSRVLQNLCRGDAGLVVEFEFAVESESSHGVGAGFDGNSSAIEQASELHHLGERLSVGLVHTGGRSQAGGEQAAANLRRQAVGDGLKAAGNLSGAVEVIFENAEGEIELGVVVLQQLYKGQDFRRLEVETGAGFSGVNQTCRGVGGLC